MQYRLRSLLTQFTLRDLFWLLVVAALASYIWSREYALQQRAFDLHLAELRVKHAEEAVSRDTKAEAEEMWKAVEQEELLRKKQFQEMSIRMQTEFAEMLKTNHQKTSEPKK